MLGLNYMYNIFHHHPQNVEKQLIFLLFLQFSRDSSDQVEPDEANLQV